MHRLVKRIKMLEKAWNEGDLQTVLSLYTDDMVLSCNEHSMASGKQGIADLLAMDAATHCEIHFQHCVPVDEDTVACTIIEINDLYRCIGIGEFRKIDIIRFRDGLICEETEACDVDQWHAMRRRIDELFASVYEWAALEKPEALVEIQAGGEVVRNKDAFVKLITLCRQWKGATRGDHPGEACA